MITKNRSITQQHLMARHGDRDATYYSMVGARDAVLLVAFWHFDADTEASCWIELDRESHRAGETAQAAWDRLIERNRHLLGPRRVRAA